MKKLSFMLALVVLAFGFIVMVGSCSNGLTGVDSQVLSASNAFITRGIKVYFNVKNGGAGLCMSKGEVGIKDEYGYYSFNWAHCASNFSVSLDYPVIAPYVVIKWEGEDFWGRVTYLSAKLSLVPGVTDYTILIDYNGRGKVYTEGLDEVSVWK